MRAVCEKCGAAQPPDWKAGDLCSACGAAVRRDVRCFWCAKWTPFARFCRSCGAELVDERLYGAARMLKDAGTDRFTVPRRLRELDPDQVENFTRLYQRQAVAVARHVDEVRLLERWLFHKTFSTALEDQLIPQLPWNDETFLALSGPPLPPGDDLSAVRAVGATSPFGVTRSLASLARIRLSDWEAYRDATAAFRGSDPTLRAEAALVLSSWRVWSSVGRYRELRDDLAGELERSPFKLEAGVRLAFLGRRNEDLLREAIASRDAELWFPAALALGDVDRLQAALSGDDLQKSVAGRKLIELGVLRPVEEILEKSPAQVQLELVESLLRRKGPAPEATETLLEIVEKTEDNTLRERAARVLCRELRPELAIRIARAARGERYIYQSLLSEDAALPPETLLEFARWMVGEGHFRMSQYGLEGAARRGAIPDPFVPGAFLRADEETRRELLLLAEIQLGARGDETLHRFVMNVALGPYPAKTRSAAWWALHRWYRQEDVRGEGPFNLEKSQIERFFGSVGEFLPRLSSVLRDPETLKEVGYYEFLARLFSEAPAASVPDLVREEAAAHDLVRAALEAAGGDYWAYLVDGLIQFLGLLGAEPRWRDEAIAGLEALGKKGNYHWEKSLRTLRLSAHGLPDESEWPRLPDDFVPARFGAATQEGRLHLLRAAEQQLIHQNSESLARFLLEAAFGPYEAPARVGALHLFCDRAPRGTPRKPALAQIAAALADRALLEDRGFCEFLDEQLGRGDPGTIAADGAAPAFVAALLGLIERPGELRGLRSTSLRLLERLSGDARWKDEVLSRMGALSQTPGFDLAGDCGRLAGRLRPPESPPARPVRDASSPTAPPENPWEAKQREAERLGKELQEAALRISFGNGSPEEKTREIMRLQEEFQTRIKRLYGM